MERQNSLLVFIYKVDETHTGTRMQNPVLILKDVYIIHNLDRHA